MQFLSPNFENNHTIPSEYTADGHNICPDFLIKNVPSDALSLVVLCHDPDASSGVPWVHWLAWAIPTTAKEILNGKLPGRSMIGMNSFGFKGYGGPSPKPGSGRHRYVFTLFAIGKGVDLSKAITYAEIVECLEGHIIDRAVWVGTYERK